MSYQEMENYQENPRILEKYGRNIIKKVKNGKIDPVIGRLETRLAKEIVSGNNIPGEKYLVEYAEDYQIT